MVRPDLRVPALVFDDLDCDALGGDALYGSCSP